MSTMPLARSVAATAAASTASSKSIVPTTSERLAGSATNGVANAERLGPAVEVRPTTRVVRATQKSRPPLAFIHSTWSASSSSVRERRRVVGLVLERVVQRGASATGTRGSSGRSRAISRDALLRGRAEQRQPQAAVGGEALLRREVVDVGLRRRRRAGRRRRRSRRSATSASPRRRALDRRPSRRSRSRCAPRRRRRTPASAVGAGASPGSALTTIGSPRNGAPAVTVANFDGELAEGQVQRALADEAERGGVPEARSCRRCRARPRSRRAARTARAGRRGRGRRRP